MRKVGLHSNSKCQEPKFIFYTKVNILNIHINVTVNEYNCALSIIIIEIIAIHKTVSIK